MKHLLSRIEKMMPGFSKGQRRIAQYIEDHYDKAAFMTASKLGATVGVSESTVVRFATEVGYDGYPQLDNGVGCITNQKDEISAEIEALTEDGFSLDTPREVSVVTGMAAYDFIRSAAKNLEKHFPGLTVHVYGVVNRFFGESITVSGLLTGGDMYEYLKDKPLGQTVFIPSVTLRHEGDLFLDNMSLDEFTEKLGVPVEPVTNDGAEFADKLTGAYEQ